jgi:hypothetical protein
LRAHSNRIELNNVNLSSNQSDLQIVLRKDASSNVLNDISPSADRINLHNVKPITYWVWTEKAQLFHPDRIPGAKIEVPVPQHWIDQNLVVDIEDFEGQTNLL